MKIFGKGGMIDFTMPDFDNDEGANSIAWGRLVELGMASEEYQQSMREHPYPFDKEQLLDIQVDEAEYASRPWWQKIF